MSNCPTCRKKLEDGQEVCGTCGPIDWTPLCPECHAALNMKKRVCPECGWRLRNNGLERIVTIAAWALVVLALGTLGTCVFLETRGGGPGLVAAVFLVGIVTLFGIWVLQEIGRHR
jgi:hypothetical protein